LLLLALLLAACGDSPAATTAPTTTTAAGTTSATTTVAGTTSATTAATAAPKVGNELVGQSYTINNTVTTAVQVFNHTDLTISDTKTVVKPKNGLFLVVKYEIDNKSQVEIYDPFPSVVDANAKVYVKGGDDNTVGSAMFSQPQYKFEQPLGAGKKGVMFSIFDVPATATGLQLSDSNGGTKFTSGGSIKPTVTTAAPATSKLNFQSFTSDKGSFSVKFPGTPTTTAQKNTVGGFQIDTNLFLVTLNSGSVTYLVSYSDYPTEITSNQTPDQALNNARDGQVASVQGKILSDKSLTKDNIFGKEIEISSTSNYIRTRIYISGQRLYQLVVVYPEATKSLGDIQTFLDSFALSNTSSDIFDNLTLVDLDQSIQDGVANSLTGVSDVQVTMYVTDLASDKVSASVDAQLRSEGYKFSLLGATAPQLQGVLYLGLYTKDGAADILTTVAPLSSNPQEFAATMKSLNIPGLNASNSADFSNQLQGKKGLIILLEGTGLAKLVNK
jgi:hypothetical protein